MQYRTHNPYEESHWVSRLRENLTSGSDGEGLETGSTVPRQSFTRQTFFRTVKQNLKIKSFIGTSENAVLIQIWSALITILLLSVLKAKALYKWHMSNLVGFIRLNLFVKIDLFEWLNYPFLQNKSPPGQIQLELF